MFYRLLVVFSLSWLSVGYASVGATHASPDLQKVVVQLDWKHQYEFAAFYAAKQQGYYQQAGLDVEIREGGPGIDATAEVVSGRADFGVNTSGVLVDRAKGAPVVALAALMQHSPVSLLALRRNGINSVQDLANKPIAVDAHNRDEVEAFLLASGLPKKDIQFVAQTDWTLNDLNNGINAAKVVYSINEVFLIRGREHEYLLLSPRSSGVDLFGNILFTHESVVAKKESVVNAFRVATLKGLVYALEHTESVTSLILQDYNTQDKSRAHLLFEAAQIKELTHPDIVEPGYMSHGRWQHVLDVYARQGKVPASFNLSAFIYDPDAKKSPLWVIVALVALIFILLIVLMVLRKMNQYTQQLQREIAQREQVQQALSLSEQHYRELVDNANVIILRLAFDGTVTYFNEYAEHFFGYTRQEVLGKHVLGTIVPMTESETNRDLSQMIDAILSTPENYQTNENENMTKDGRRVFIHWTNRVLFDGQQCATGVLSIGHDITDRRLADEKIHALAFYDPLTALPNRRLMLDRLHQAVLQHQRNGQYGALLFIDLDNFKVLNDSQGHQTGDRLLIQVAQRLREHCQLGDSIARLGGDEFIVMFEDVSDNPLLALSTVEQMAQALLEALSQPYNLPYGSSPITASIGVALFRDKQDSVDELLKRADLAMYQAKAAGRNMVRFFDPMMQELLVQRTQLETALRQAIEQQQFILYYQPQVDMHNQVIGVEVLVRWQHPDRGVISPFEFIGLAEDTGLIWEIGLMVLDQACAQLRQWQQLPDANKVNLSVNISAHQFHHADFVSSVLAAIEKHHVDARFLMLEITESLLLKNVGDVIAKMQLLKTVGIRFSIDDFGTGYSSLAYLKRLPLDELKIDRSFIMDITTDDNAAAIVNAFISLAHLLDLHVVAEGVENDAQQAFLGKNGCDLIQGFLFSRPVPSEQMTQMLKG
jgi:diguanylate cyclase (GGDEF)-like protein/PAS domain S-box-containing protein